MEERIYSVSEIAREIKRVITQFIPPVWIEGEISNYSASRVGHIYFSLKDDEALINCVVWRNVAGRIPFHLSTGMRVMVRGEIITYAAQSQYQINVREIRAAGMGTLFMAFEALKKKLSEEGLFDAELKQPIPPMPSRIGVVTSISGAAVRDILQVSERRNPSIEIVLFPAQVQGDQAADSIIAGIETFNKLKNVDFIIIGRGGGSIEDLWAFNEEKLIRAIVASELPVVSAVGHEVDFTLAGFAADFRAPTPSAAAELAIPERDAITEKIDHYLQRLLQSLTSRISNRMQYIDQLHTRLRHFNPQVVIEQKFTRLTDLKKQIYHTAAQIIHHSQLRLNDYRSTIHALDPKGILKRGYSIVYSQPDNKVVKSVRKVRKGQKIRVEVSDGHYAANVETTPK